MSSITVENLTFDFNATIDASKYDEWSHYTQVWNKHPASQKAMDVVAVETSAAPPITWMIEAKDFRVVNPGSPPKPSNVTTLPQTVANKAAHTWAGLTDAAARASDAFEKGLAIKATRTSGKRIVLHLEPHNGPHSALFPTAFAASVLQKLRQLTKAIDPNPLVLSIATTPLSGVPWTVR